MFSKEFEKTLASIDQEFSKGTIYKLDDNSGIEVARTSTGRLSLDLPIGGGLPDGRIIEFYGGESSGKAQPLSSKIHTPYGWIKMRDIKVGQEISTPDGCKSTVIGIYPQGEQDVYEVTLDDKTSVKCTLDHLFYVEGRKDNSGEVVSIKELLNRKLKSKRGVRNYKIPITQPVDYYKSESLPIDPYLLGFLLGDGHLKYSSVKFSTIDTEILDKITVILEKTFPSLEISEKIGKCDYRIRNKKNSISRNNPLMDSLRNLGQYDNYSFEKRVPKLYMKLPLLDRIKLIQGLMDSDGFIGEDGTMSFSTTSIGLSKDFENLCRSMGMRVTTSSRLTKYKKQDNSYVDGRMSYRSSLLFGTFIFEVVSLKRKKERLKNSFSTHSYKFIESIKKVGKEKCQCIMIGHPDHLYITDDFNVTHNTTAAIHAIAQHQSEGKGCAFVDYEHAFDPEYARGLGVNTKELVFTQPSYAEQGLSLVEKLIDTGELRLIVVDSVAAMLPKSELEGDMGDLKMGVHARLMSQAMRKIAGKAYKNNTTIIFINQTRDKIGVMFGSPVTTAGGNALKFYASARVEFYRGAQIKGKGDEVKDTIANRGKIKVVKNKTYPPYKTSEYDLEYGKGISKEGDIVDYGVEFGIVNKSGSWFSYADTKLGQGKESVKQLLADNPELCEEIENLIKQHL